MARAPSHTYSRAGARSAARNPIQPPASGSFKSACSSATNLNGAIHVILDHNMGPGVRPWPSLGHAEA